MQRLINLVCLALAVGWTIFIGIIAIPTFLISQTAGHFLHRLWGQGWLLLFDIRVRVIGQENVPSGAVILAPNHESMFDIFVMASLPWNFKWLSKEEVGRIPLVGWVMKVMGCLFVSRGQSGKDINVMKKVEDGIRSGLSAAIFPEGTRTRSGELLPFKKGAFRTSQNTGAPLIPIAIIGTYEIAPPNSVPKKRRHTVTVRIGKPVVPTSGELPEALLERFRNDLISLRNQGHG